jgi:hypothetical protein
MLGCNRLGLPMTLVVLLTGNLAWGAADAPRGVQNILEIHTTTVTLTTQQVEKIHRKNSTQNPERYREVVTTKETFDAKSAVESIRETTKSTTTNVSGTVSANWSGGALGGSAGGSASATAGATFQNLVKTFYKTTGEVETFKSKETITTDEVTLSPGDELIVYTNTTSGGSYSYSWDTTEKLSEAAARPITIDITVTYDLTPVFIALMQAAAESYKLDIVADRGEWEDFKNICNAAEQGGLNTYILGVTRGLNDPGIPEHLRADIVAISDEHSDRDSWRVVRDSARRAAKIYDTDQAAALKSILIGFRDITDPEHNGAAWERLHELAKKYLSQ